jgi:hypothetical protein
VDDSKSAAVLTTRTVSAVAMGVRSVCDGSMRTYGQLGKLGGRWAWHSDTRDAVIATIPDAHFETAVEIAMARDSTR